ncbi:MAG: hypothetical protein LBR11_08710 [Deltaproteobacteria bacterium]|jgi:hypothetical protein|nr:hypothetical protein [Deltaproteobacteria bacterium]
MVFRARRARLLVALLFSLLGIGLPVVAPGLETTEPQAYPKAELETRLATARSILLSAQASDLSQSYRFQLEKALVLYYQASLIAPDAPEVWSRLGRLAEIRGLWAEDPQSQEALMAEARGHFLKAARLGQRGARPPEPVAPNPAAGSADPFVAELLWSSRLRRGEITTEELTRHYAFNDQNPLYQPGLWVDRRFILLSEPEPAKRDELLSLYQREFDEVWSAMPVEAPNQRPGGPARLKKIEVLLAWAETLLALINPSVSPPASTAPGSASQPSFLAPQTTPSQTTPSQTAPPWSPTSQGPTLFSEALSLGRRALSLPLGSTETNRLLTSLGQAELKVPSPALRDDLWAFRDLLFTNWLKAQPTNAEIWAVWGQDYYQRAATQADDKLWASLRAEGARKFLKAVELSSHQDQARAQWGRVLEIGAYNAPARPGSPPAESLAARYHKSLTEAQEQYRLAWERGEKLDTLESLARVSALLAFEAKTEEGFQTAFGEATRLGRLLVRYADNPAQAWLNWAQICLAFRERELAANFRSAVIAEIFAAHNHYLSSNAAQIPTLIELADEVWSLAAQFPEAQDQALSLLIDLCRRLARLAPAEPGYGFALGLAVFAQLANRPAWPDDPAVTSDPTAKKAFEEVLAAFLESLDSLSQWSPSSDSPPPSGQAQAYEPLRFLAPEVGQAWVYAPGSTFQERLASALNRPVGRLLAMARPETLPPWHQLRLAAFLRLVAASGYPPAEEQMAYWRLALRYLRLAREKDGPNQDLGAILAEEGLILAELNLLNPTPDPALLTEAETLWARAERLAPGSSRYAQARWAAWLGDQARLIKSLAHPPAWEDNLTWPSFPMAMSDPAFRAFRGASWLKSAWYGYSR